MIDNTPSPAAKEPVSRSYVCLEGVFDVDVFELDVHRIWTAMASDPEWTTTAFVDFAMSTDSKMYVYAVAEGITLDWAEWIVYTCPKEHTAEQLQRLQGYALMLREIGLGRPPVGTPSKVGG